MGFCTTGPVTFETAAYVARYVCKKVNGDLAGAHYAGRQPEFMTCSKGIGERWIQKYAPDTLRDDFVVARGREQPLPRYYRKKLELVQPSAARSNEIARLVRANTREARYQRTPERLAVRETVTTARSNLSGRR